MNAFVKTTKGNFPNQNFYLAWKGWDEMGYQVHKFEEEELDGPEIWKWLTKETPVFAGVTVFDKVLKKLDLYDDLHNHGTYPLCLRKYMATEVRESTLGEVRAEFNRTAISVFVKPIKQKVFTGELLRNTLNLINIANVPDDCKVYVGYPVEFLSEFRCYIQDEEILTAKHYAGDWTKIPDPDVIKRAVKDLLPQPSAYALDFGVVNDKCHGEVTALIEYNDATSLGNYGLDSINYAEMLTSRWFQIVDTSDRRKADNAARERVYFKT